MLTKEQCRSQLTKLMSNNICRDEIENTLKDCSPSLIQNKLGYYSGQCLSQKETELIEATKAKINEIDIDTEKDQLDAIKISATQFDLTKELFEKRYEDIQKQFYK